MRFTRRRRRRRRRQHQIRHRNASLGKKECFSVGGQESKYKLYAWHRVGARGEYDGLEGDREDSPLTQDRVFIDG